jgi:tetratricopeptide (TPR) repeat protein
VASFLDAFPQSQLWYNTQELLLIGSVSDEIKLKQDRFEMLKLHNSLRQDLDFAYWGGVNHRLNRPEVFLGGFLTGPEGLKKLSKGAMIYRDDRPILEYSTVRQALFSSPTVKLIFENMASVSSIIDFEIDSPTSVLSQSIREKNLRNIIALGTITSGEYSRTGSNVQDSVGMLRKLVELNPENIIFNQKLANALASAGNHDEAIHYYRSALEIDPNFVKASYKLGRIFSSQGNFLEAIKYYRQTLIVRPDHAKAHFGMGTALMAQSKITEAIQHYFEAIRINPYFADAHYYLGNALAALNRKEEAIVHYNKALDINPEFVEAIVNIGVTFEEQGNIAEAIEHYDKALAIKPMTPLALENLARINKNRKEYQSAIHFYKEILKVMPGNPVVYYNLACVYALQNKTEEALGWLKKAVNNGFNNWNLLKTDHELENIRDTSDYKALIKEK